MAYLWSVSESAGKTILRPLREEDAEAVASLYHLAFGDDRPLDAEEIVSWRVLSSWPRTGRDRGFEARRFANCMRGGLRKIQLGVDAENTTGASGLYERVGMRIVRRQDNWLTDL